MHGRAFVSCGADGCNARGHTRAGGVEVGTGVRARGATMLVAMKLRLSLLGSPHLLRDGAAAVALAPRDAVMLAWLAIVGPTTRAQMAAMLWPDRGEEQARNSLRQRLFQLRRQLGVDLIVGAVSMELAGHRRTRPGQRQRTARRPDPPRMPVAARLAPGHAGTARKAPARAVDRQARCARGPERLDCGAAARRKPLSTSIRSANTLTAGSCGCTTCGATALRPCWPSTGSNVA